jgi:hypothetical protein
LQYTKNLKQAEAVYQMKVPIKLQDTQGISPETTAAYLTTNVHLRSGEDAK